VAYASGSGRNGPSHLPLDEQGRLDDRRCGSELLRELRDPVPSEPRTAALNGSLTNIPHLGGNVYGNLAGIDVSATRKFCSREVATA